MAKSESLKIKQLRVFSQRNLMSWVSSSLITLYACSDGDLFMALHLLAKQKDVPEDIQAFVRRFIIDELKVIFFLFLKSQGVYAKFVYNCNKYSWNVDDGQFYHGNENENGITYFYNHHPQYWISQAFPWDEEDGRNTRDSNFQKWLKLHTLWETKLHSVLKAVLNV